MVDEDDVEHDVYHMKMLLEILVAAVSIGFCYVTELPVTNITTITTFYVLARVMEANAKMHEKMHVRFDTNEIGN